MLRICPYKAGVGGSSPSTPTTLARARSTALLMARLLSRWVWVVRNRSGVGTRPDLSSVSREQKQQVVRMLNEHGASLFCGAVEEVADLMGVSRITIYNYLNATRREPVASTTD